MIESVRIKSFLDDLLTWLENDIKNTPKEDSYLFKVLGDVEVQGVNFYDQGVSIFGRSKKSPRKIKTTFEFPKDISSLPTLLLREPTRREEDNIIGVNTAIEPLPMYNVYASEYDILCFSDSFIESLIISEIVYALLVSAHDSLSPYYSKLKYSMKELQVNSELIPTPIMIRSVNLTCQIQKSYPSLTDYTKLGKVIFDYPPCLLDE